MQIKNHVIEIETREGISIFNITPQILGYLDESGIKNGFVVVSSRHTTTALAINEHEERLLEDIRAFFTKLVPAGDNYLHNDIHLRDCPPDEPENAHSHIAALLFGSSEAIPVANGELAIGQYQSVMLIELDGPRPRTVNVQICGE